MAVTREITRLDYNVLKVAEITPGATQVLYWYDEERLIQAATFPRERIFTVPPRRSRQIQILDTTDAPDPAHTREILIYWLSVSGAIKYFVQQWIGEGAAGNDLPVDDASWQTLRTVIASAEEVYNHLTDWLDDLTEYTFRVVPMNAENIEGEGLLMTFVVVGRPDAPGTTLAYDADTQRVTVAAAA